MNSIKLFSVKDSITNKVIIQTDKAGVKISAFFPNKKDAKQFRNMLNEQIPNSCHVSKGPDHRDYIGCSQNKGRR